MASNYTPESITEHEIRSRPVIIFKGDKKRPTNESAQKRKTRKMISDDILREQMKIYDGQIDPLEAQIQLIKKESEKLQQKFKKATDKDKLLIQLKTDLMNRQAFFMSTYRLNMQIDRNELRKELINTKGEI